ncbi:amidohydrolase 2, partial [Stereum hirsutum FP-91666 SS1]|uniref:amidohydrolase 2 n=1 Tax=Stereum hirsutum (strain FP-91666) TaxID=721885 RepID=UPI000440F532
IRIDVYLPRYADWLRSRSAAPRVYTNEKGEERLLILDDEPSGGRPVGPQYWDRDEKLKFMDQHGIDISVVSSANPWLDFLPPSEAHELALGLNDDLETYCATGPAFSDSSIQRLYGLGLLPLVPGISIPKVLECVAQIAAAPHLKGLIMGTKGIGKGLDDDALDPVWKAIEAAGLLVFLHPHYGVDSSAWGEKDNGHVLPLALGFPVETAVAATRFILSGAFDKYPSLIILLAHSGGALPALSSRLASCIDHDPIVADRLKHDARYYLGKFYFDAVAYGPEELGFVSETDRKVGSLKMLFGTDHPFFPPLKGQVKWKSVVENLEAISEVSGWGEAEKNAVRGGNALRIFGLGQ